MTIKFGLLKLVMLAVFAMCSTAAFSQKSRENLGSPDRFISNLERDGFSVSEGASMHFNPIRQYSAGYLPNALYGNYGAPYAAAVVPVPEGSAPTPLGGPEFRLAPDEAIVLIGLTPPREKYFSYQIYLSHRLYPPKTEPDFLLNSLGDTVNIQTINTIGPDPFERPMVLIFTSDKDIEVRIRAALRSAGYPAAIMNTLVVPSSMLKLGLDENSDTFLIANRNALFEDPTAEELYVAQPTFRVFRVTPEGPVTLNPFLTPPLRVRGTGQTEMDLMPDLDRLRQNILDYYSDDFTATEYFTQGIANEGYDYTQRHAITLGDTRDALYFGSGYLPEYGLEDELKLGNGDFLIAYGVNHVALGKATYTNINGYASETAKLGLGGIFSKDMEGSAYPYLGQNDPVLDLTYAYKISRNCDGESFCLELTVPDECSGKITLGSDTLLGIAFRLYLEPSTNVGPAYPEILYDRIIKFSPNP